MEDSNNTGNHNDDCQHNDNPLLLGGGHHPPSPSHLPTTRPSFLRVIENHEDLGHRIQEAHLAYVMGVAKENHKTGSHTKKKLLILVGVLFGSCVVVIASIKVALELLLPTDLNKEKSYNDFLEQDIYDDIIDATIPSIRTWYRQQSSDGKPWLPLLASSSISFPSATTTSNTTASNNNNCVERFFQSLYDVVHQTSPASEKRKLNFSRLGARILRSGAPILNFLFKN